MEHKKALPEAYFWLEPISKCFGLSHIETVTYFVYFLLIIIAIIIRLQLKLLPEHNLAVLVENGIEALENFLRENIVGEEARRILPLFFALVLFIFFSNLLGLIPGLRSPTGDWNTTIALAVCVMLYSYVCGIKKRGWHFLKLFTGSKWYFAFPFGILFGIIDQIVRPFSLSIRLFVNMASKHLLLCSLSILIILLFEGGILRSVIQTLGIPFIMPLFIMCLGLISCFVQTFVFIILSGLYIKEAIGAEED